MALRSGASEAVRKLRDLLLSQLGQGILGAKGFQEVLQGCLKTIRGSIVRSLSTPRWELRLLCALMFAVSATQPMIVLRVPQCH